MKFIIADTEATGLNPQVVDMLSFGAFSVETGENGLLDFSSLEGIHRFFNTDKEVPAEASRVNGLTRQICFDKSNGDYLEDCYEELSNFVYRPDALFTGYNTSFDATVLRCNFLRLGLPEPKWGGMYDVMQEQKILLKGTGYETRRGIKLTTASDIIFRQKKVYTKEQLNKAFAVIVRTLELGEPEAQYHSALYDAFITMMILNRILLYKKT